MANFNKVIIVGNITRDIELRYTPSGTAVADITVAVNEKRKDQETTAFVDCTMWDKTAENCAEYLGKGSPILVEGRLQQDNWEDKETGKKRSKLKVVASNVQFLSNKGEGGGGGGQRQEQRQQQPQQQPNNDFPSGSEIPF